MNRSVEMISSTANPKVKWLVRLRDRSHRDAEGVFVVEGYRAISRMLDQGIVPAELVVARSWFQGTNNDSLIQRAVSAGAEVTEFDREPFAKVAYRDRPDGLLAVVPQWRRSLADLELSANPFVLVVEAIEKPGNLGTILRSADAAGVDAVIVCDPVTDVFNPNVVRSSTGVLFAVPLVVTDSPSVLEFLRARSVSVASTTPAAELRYTDASLAGPLALVMGSEMHGLSPFWLENSDLLVSIPMAGQADSLNVAMATIVTLFEAVRQRTEPVRR